MENPLPDVDQLAPNATPAAARTLADWERELDACMHAVYGCSLAEYRHKMFTHGTVWGFERGEQKGRAAGRRRAKGLPPAKKRGRQPEIPEHERALIIHVVETREPGQTIKEAVTDCLHYSELGRRLSRWENNLANRSDTSSVPDHVRRVVIKPADVNKALWAYYRHRPRT
jgi:hypothetical protein